MFTVDDFIKLLKYFKTGVSTGLDDNLIIQAENAKATTTTLFNENLDLPVHSSEDYKRLKEVFTRWYASLKTINDVMRHASDARSLPETHLNTLINSFGFTDQLDQITYENKVDFFYDLVNLYKIKGTTESLSRALGYFGFPDVDILEYWLQYNTHGNLIFRPEVVSSDSGLNIAARDLNFQQVTNPDPHWMITEDQINQIFLSQKISFPSKSPYFSIRPTMEITGNAINPLITILQRMVQDQYQNFVLGTLPTKDIFINATGEYVSLLDLYLSVLYIFNLAYPKTEDSSDASLLCYNGSMSLSNTEIMDYYELLSSRRDLTRDQLESNKLLLNQYFTRLRSTNFLTSLTKAGEVLTLTNLTFKENIDALYSGDLGDPEVIGGSELLKLLLNDLSNWSIDNISVGAPFLTSLVLGFESVDKINKVIDFFKPYRARLILVEHGYLIKNPLLDSVIPSDSCIDEIEQLVIDFDTASGLPSTEIDDDTSVMSIPPDDNCKRIDDIYMDGSGLIKCKYYTEPFAGVTNFINSYPPIGAHRILNIYLDEVPEGGKRLHIVYESVPETILGRTILRSEPPPGFYPILNAYLNSSLQLEVIFEDNLDEERLYYSRESYDNDSYFDIGASIDFESPVRRAISTEDEDPITTEDGDYVGLENDYYKNMSSRGSHVRVNIEETYHEKYNAHIADSTVIVDFRYVEDDDLGISEIWTDGGWVETDTGLFFDTPAVSDVCQILVQVMFSFTITSSVVGGIGGEIDPLGVREVEEGYSKTFTITPTSGYEILDVLVDSVSQGAITEYEFTNVMDDHTISVEFLQQKVYTLGELVTFHTTYTQYPTAEWLYDDEDLSYFVVAYRSQSIGESGKARIGTANQVTGEVLFSGSEVTFDVDGWNVYNTITKLTDTTFVISYESGAMMGGGRSVFGTASGYNITFGTPAEYDTNINGDVPTTSRLTDTTFVIAYAGYYSKIGTVTGTNISFGPRYMYDELEMSFYLSLTALTSDKFVLTHIGDNDSWPNHLVIPRGIKVGNISGGVITYGDNFSFDEDGWGDFSVKRLSDTTFVMVYSQDYDGYAKIGTVNGNNITFGEAACFCNGIDYGVTEYIEMVMITSDSFAISWPDQYYDTMRTSVGFIDGENITFLDSVESFDLKGPNGICKTKDGSYILVDNWNPGAVVLNRYDYPV